MAQIRRRDRAAGLNTAGFISGYRGSPLGGYDQQLWRAKAPRDNTTSNSSPASTKTSRPPRSGARSSSICRPAPTMMAWSASGTARAPASTAAATCSARQRRGLGQEWRRAGLAGDDHGAKSSTVPHQSDHAFISALMPISIPPASMNMIEMGLLGIAMSRYSGCWVGMKVITETWRPRRRSTLQPTR
jgi:indolepyruvate ferredoxin oxidoreductase